MVATALPPSSQTIFFIPSLRILGMFGNGNGFGITYMPLHTLGLTIGGIQTKPGYVHGEIVPCEYLSVTIAFDHDIVDGAPAARFAKDLVAFIQDGGLLLDQRKENENKENNI
jgi:pyruvate/2-oxoglutarate dehydrogenase complex dihydrolipoamide acyltransferase (E2) component